MSDTPCVDGCGQDAATIERLREQLAKVEAAFENMPILLSAIERDLARTPSARGGEVHFHPGTAKRGKCGCPGDNITRWLDEVRAALAPQDVPRSAAGAPEAPGQPGRGERVSGGRTEALARVLRLAADGETSDFGGYSVRDSGAVARVLIADPGPLLEALAEAGVLQRDEDALIHYRHGVNFGTLRARSTPESIAAAVRQYEQATHGPIGVERVETRATFAHTTEWRPDARP